LCHAILDEHEDEQNAMKAVIQHLWYEALSSFWFLPVLTMIGAVGLFILSSHLERNILSDMIASGWLIGRVGLETARTILSAIATSMVTIAGLVIPITIIAIQLASQEYGARLIRDFMRDRLIQLSLGIFFAAFIYSLLVLTRLPEENMEAFPRLSIFIAILLSLIGVVILITFIHRIARLVQPYNIVAKIAEDLEKTSTAFFNLIRDKDSSLGQNHQDKIPDSFEIDSRRFLTSSSGYINKINYNDLVELADQHDFLMQIMCRPGEFVLKGDTLALAYPPSRFTGRLIGKIDNLFILGNEKTIEMDIEFPVEQLLEVAARSLTEDTNDLFTAGTCLDWLENSFVHVLLKSREVSNNLYYGDKLRLIVKIFKASDLINHALHVCWASAKNNKGLTVITAIHLMKIITRLAEYVNTKEEHGVLKMHAGAIKASIVNDASLEAYEHREITVRYQEAVKALSSFRR
jgi:uncharacterized membrane protein